MKTIPKQEKLHARLTEYYNALATIDTLSDKEAEKLYKRIDRTIQRLKQEEEESREWVKLLASSSDELEARVRDTKNSEKKVLGLSRAPANGTIDYRENITHHFARGTNGYKLFIIFFVGSIAGFVAESIWCIMRHGYYESRQGLVYGPFSPIYGIGAVCLTAALYQYRNRSASYSFWGGLITGTLVEYICSWVQEKLFHSTSWDYSHLPLNINGRVCLLYSVFWGVLGVLWIKSIYPRMGILTLKIPDRIGKILVWILLVFMIFNCLISAFAVIRWAERVDGKNATNSFERFFDRHFDDERMHKIYANLDFSNTGQ